MMRACILLPTVAIVSGLLSAHGALAGPAYAIHRVGSFSTPGDFVRFDTNDPGGGELLGNLGIGNVGTMDYHNGQLWAVSGDNNVMSFYTIDVGSVEATFQSSFNGSFGGTSVFSGSFDDDGAYWVVDFESDKIRQMDPFAGTMLHEAPIEAAAGYNGVAFVGDTLYAVRGAFGDPPQDFGILDPMTGQYTSIGRTFVGVDGNGGGNGTGALDYDPVTDTMYLMYRAGIESGQLWSLYTVDLDTGAATFVGEMQPERNYDAMSIVPEPTSLGLLLIGATAMLRRRQRNDEPCGTHSEG